jgi:hypothetical protein
VIANPTLSPDSWGRMNTNILRRDMNITGKSDNWHVYEWLYNNICHY